jgi:hypothetical protein
MKPVSAAQHNHILSLLDSGHSGYDISSQIGVSVASLEYAPAIVLTSKKLLVVTLLSFLSRIYAMLFDSLALEKLKMLSKWLKHFRIAPTNLSPSKLYEIAWRKWGWKLWWRRKDHFLPRGIEGKG